MRKANVECFKRSINRLVQNRFKTFVKLKLEMSNFDE